MTDKLTPSYVLYRWVVPLGGWICALIYAWQLLVVPLAEVPFAIAGLPAPELPSLGTWSFLKVTIIIFRLSYLEIYGKNCLWLRLPRYHCPFCRLSIFIVQAVNRMKER